MNDAPAYFDYNATAPLKAAALAKSCAVMAEVGNASSVHRYGRAARKHVEDARNAVARLVNVKPTQVIFNSGATEGNNTILKHFRGQRILTSAIEHPAVREAVPDAERIPVTRDGIIDLAVLRDLLAREPTPALVSVMWVNNEIGTIQPVAEAAKLAKDAGALFHTDAVQAAGRVPVDMMKLGADFLTLSSHKMGGPQGVGALIVGPCNPAPVLLHGGGQERRQRAGTENVAGIAGMGAAAEAALADYEAFCALAKLRDKMEAGMKAACPSLFVNGGGAARVANTLNVCIPGMDAQMMLMNLDLAGFAVGSGSACSSGTMKPSPVLLAMGVAEEDARSSLRLSIGWDTTEAEIDNFLRAWDALCDRLQLRKKEEPARA